MNAPDKLPSTMSVYQAINRVQSELASVGISKDRTNTQGQGYKFRGIDDVYNTLSRLLATHGLCILPRMLSRTCDERQSKSGGALFYVTVEAEFDFVSAADGSKHTVKTFGEAMDSGDKATNKAMSAAYKYAAFQAFAIPTQGDNDADAHTHEVAPKKATKPPVKAALEGVEINPEDMAYLRELAAELVHRCEVEGKVSDAYDAMTSAMLDADQKLQLWEILAPNSKTRSALKKEGEARRAAAKAPLTEGERLAGVV